MAEATWSQMHKDATTSLTGEFPVVFVDPCTGVKSGNGKDMVKWKAKIETGPYAGRPLWGNFTISPESPVAMRIFFSHMAILGFDQRFFAANDQLTGEQMVALIAQQLPGRKAIAEVGVRQWQGQDREEVQNWKLALGGAAGTAPGVLSGLATGGGGIPKATVTGIPASSGIPASVASGIPSSPVQTTSEPPAPPSF